jgi:hypothetical protein
MFEQPEIQQATLSVWFRGPEVAFAIREGDLAALDAVLRTCRFWNGAGSLIVPVRADGRTWPVIEQLLEVRPVEVCLFHESVPERARERLRTGLAPHVADWSEFWDTFDDRELHPLMLQPSWRGEAPKPSLLIPRFHSARLDRIALATWGYVPDDELADYRQAFDLGEVEGGAAHIRLLEGQLTQLSPLGQSVKLMRHFGAVSAGRQLWVFGRATFGDLVEFWNYRSRMRDVDERPLLIGIARDALREPETLTPLARWLGTESYVEHTPDLGVVTHPEDRELARAALTGIGFEEATRADVSRRIGSTRRAESLTFGFYRTFPGGPIRRGANTHDQLTLTAGSASYRIARPADFIARGGNSIRVGIEGLPLAFPLTKALASAVVSNGYPSREGLTIHTNAWAGDGYLPIALPDGFETLRLWAADSGDAQLSQAGRYAQALLERLGALDALATLASESAVAILTALAPLSRKKLAQRVVAEAQDKVGIQLDEERLAEMLKEEALFLELRARTAADLVQPGVKKGDILAPLEALVAAGFVTRGAAIECPICEYGDVLALSEQDERVVCRACHADFLLPVVDPSGRAERPPVYRLDGLMARAMDQDLLPVLLALNSTQTDQPLLRAAWPGVNVAGPNGQAEYDLIASDGENVWVAECKARAGVLPQAQLDGLLDFCRRHSALPVLAALDGAFAAEQRDAVLERGGRVLERAQLLCAN